MGISCSVSTLGISSGWTSSQSASSNVPGRLEASPNIAFSCFSSLICSPVGSSIGHDQEALVSYGPDDDIVEIFPFANKKVLGIQGFAS